MKTLNSVAVSKIQLQNPRNALKFRTQFLFPSNSLLCSSSCNVKNGGTLTLTLYYGRRKTVFSELRTSENKTTKGKNKSSQAPTTTKIQAPEPGGAPEVSGGGGPPPPPSKKAGSWKLKGLPKKVVALLSNLPLAIGEMFSVAALMALGTFIEQGEAPSFYMKKFSEDNPVLGFFTWRWILALGFDHMFSSPIFLGTLILLGLSLMACTYTTQIPLVKVARRWSFLHSADSIRKQEYSDILPNASVQDFGVVLMGAGYEVFKKGPALYAFRGLAGRVAPIGVHLALLLIMAGGTLSAAGSFRGSVTVPQGLNFVVGDVLGPSGFLSTPSESFNTEVHVNRFSMDYYESGEVSQFFSDLSLSDLNGKEVMRETISVNHPLRYGGVTIYQTDWSLSALQVMKDDEGPFNLALAPLQINGDKKLYGTFLPIQDAESTNLKGISLLCRDMQSVVLYDQEGKFAGVRRPNSKLPIEIDGVKIVVLEAIGSTGLELKLLLLHRLIPGCLLFTRVLAFSCSPLASAFYLIHRGSKTFELESHQHRGDIIINASCKSKTWEESKKMWEIAAPAIIGTVAQFSIGVVTVAFAGHLGDLELAAVSIVQNVLEGFVFGIMLGMGSALETLCGQAVGAGQYEMLGIYMQRSCIITITTAFALAPLYIFTSPILKLLRQSHNISELAGKYAQWVIPQLFAYALNFPLQKFLQAQSRIWVMTIISVLVLGFHVVLNWILITKLEKGLLGAAVAENISWWLLVLAQLLYVVSGFFPESWTGFSLSAFKSLYSFVKLSIASAVMLCLELWYYTIVILMVGWLKNPEIAVDAISICMNVELWTLMIALGFNAAISVRVGNELGANNPKAAKFSVVVTVMTSMIFGSIIAIAVVATQNTFPRLFSSKDEVIKETSKLAYFLAATIFLNSIQSVLHGVAVGAGWQVSVAVINVVCYYVCGLPFGALLGYKLDLGVKGIWLGMLAGCLLQTAILSIIVLRASWTKEALYAEERIRSYGTPTNNRSAQNGSDSLQLQLQLQSTK